MRGGGGRGAARGVWTVARLQRIGNWGRADEALGRQWEEVGLAALAGQLDAPRLTALGEYVPRAVVALADDEALRREIHATGLPNPDAALLGTRAPDAAVLQPVDFKWALERAELPQVSAVTLERLLGAAVPQVQAHLAAVEQAAGLAVATLEYVDGLFFAPEHPENRAFLASEANAHAESPLTLADVVLCPVDPEAFFGPLDGWELGRWLAEMDRSVGLLATIDGAERYFRLGAGFAGALTRLATPLFAETPTAIDARAALVRLRTSRHLFTSVDLASYLERQMAARGALERGLRDLATAVYPFRVFRAQLAASGVKLDAVEDDQKRGYRERYRGALNAVRARLREEGRALVAAGQSEPAALAELQARTPELQKTAQAMARKALSAAP
ncbi:MAG TPA: hypothetical protein VK066_00910 [Chloroflexota bacterium]|nr:hypothetical protein [Chloroflexota bacterium]